MRTHVSAVEGDTHATDAFDFVADAEKLPIWAIGFVNGRRARRGPLADHPGQRRPRPDADRGQPRDRGPSITSCSPRWASRCRLLRLLCVGVPCPCSLGFVASARRRAVRAERAAVSRVPSMLRP
jgi:hypothetical protein